MADYSNSAIPRNDNIAIMTNDIRQTLGLPNTTINNRFGRLCVSENVEMWAKYKPFSYPSISPDRENAKTVEPFLFYNLTDENLKAKIKYLRPTGGEQSPYRIYDFVNYKHSAICPFSLYPINSMYEDKEYYIKIGMQPVDKYNMQMKDVLNNELSSMYFAVCIKNGNQFYIKTSDTTISPTGDSTVKVRPLDIGNITGSNTLYMLVTNERIAEWTNNPTCNMFALNNDDFSAWCDLEVKPAQVDTFEAQIANIGGKEVLRVMPVYTVEQDVFKFKATCVQAHTGYLYLSKIRYTVTRADDGQVFFDEEVYPDRQYDKPESFNALQQGTQYTFTVRKQRKDFYPQKGLIHKHTLIYT